MKKFDLLVLREQREQWSPVNEDTMDTETKSLYTRRKHAVDLYIDGVSPKIIQTREGINGTEIIRLLNRCVSLDESGKQAGYSALIPGKLINDRKSRLEDLFHRYPDLEKFVLGNYFGDKKYTLEHNMNIRTLHSKFERECKRIGLQDFDYPFTLQDNGYYSLYRYIKKKELEQPSLSIKRENQNMQQKFNSTGYGNGITLNPLHPFDIVQIDGHRIDLLYSVEVETEQGEVIYMPATRAWLIAVIDVASRAIIGYSVSPYENYNQYDVMQAVQNSIVPHERIEFTHTGFSYPENGGFPSLALKGTEWASFNMIMLDNAKSHLAKNTVDKLTNTVKCGVNFGSVATPETRGIIERFFGTLERAGFHRLPGTTGSNVYDNKKKDPEKESAKYKITYTDVCELIEYLIAEYNNSAHSALKNETPLQRMERRLNGGLQPCVIPYEERENVEKLTHFTVERTLRGGYASGQKPYLSFNGTRYHAYDIKIPMELVGNKVYIEVNPDDVSHVDLYTDDGTFIANLVAMGEYGRHQHSLRTHLAAQKHAKQNAQENTLFTPNLSEYEDDLRNNATKSRRDRTKSSIIMRESGVTEEEKKDKKEEPSKVIPIHKEKQGKTHYSKEEMDIINSMSIEEAYAKGLI